MERQKRFDRGLSGPVVELLNREYRDPKSLWRSILHDARLFVAVRDGYLNAYRHGCSLVKLTPLVRKGIIKGETDPKYLVRGDAGVVSHNGVVVSDQQLAMYTDLIKDRSHILETMIKFAGPEARGITELHAASSTILDAEVVVPGIKRRIDLVTLNHSRDGWALRFYEAKTVFDARVRASGDVLPKVVSQLRAYEDILASRAEEIVAAYQNVIANFLALDGIAAERKAFLGAVDPATLRLETTPYLIFVGYDRAQMDWWRASTHCRKLVAEIGSHRVLFKKTL